MKLPDKLAKYGALIISNYAVNDTKFDCDIGSWNVTRAVLDCAAGLHKAYTFDTADVLSHNLAIDVDEAKVAAMVKDRERFAQSPPPIFAIENGRAWLIDGHHRLRALDRLGEPKFLAYVIEEKDGARYRIYYNGQRVAPWYKP